MKSAFLLVVWSDFFVYKELILSFSRRRLFLASSSSSTRAVRLAVAAFLIPVDGFGVEVPDCGVADRERLAATGLASSFALLPRSCEPSAAISALLSPFAFRFLLPLTFLREWLSPRDLRVSIRSITKVLSFSVLGRIGTT